MIRVTQKQAIDAYSKVFSPLSSWQLNPLNIKGLVEEMSQVANAPSVEEAKKLLIEKYDYSFYDTDNVDEVVFKLRKELGVSVDETFAKTALETYEASKILRDLIDTYGSKTILDFLKDAKEQFEAE